MDAAGLQEQMHGQMRRRVDLGPRIKAYGERAASYPGADAGRSRHGYAEGFRHDVAVGAKPSDPLKEERNAIAAYFLPEAWTYVRGAREGFVPPQVSDPRSIPAEYSKAIERFTGRLLDEWSDTREERLLAPRAEWGPADHAYDRLVRVLSESAKAGRVAKSAAAPSGFMKVGLGTGSQVDWSLIQLVPELAKRKGISLGPDEAERVVRGAYGEMVLQPASTHLDIGPVMLNELSKRDRAEFGFEPEHFDLVTDESGRRKVVVSDAALGGQLGDTFRRIFSRTPASDATWCPARYSKLTPGPDGERVDIIDDYFRWNLALARERYFPQVATDN